MSKNFGKIILLNILGLTIFFSWYLPANHGFWFPIDKSIFYYFNEQLVAGSNFLYLVGLTNIRHFDLISLLAMLSLYGYYYAKQDRVGKRRMWLLGVTMLLVAVILNQLGHLIPVKRCSPTGFFEDVNRVSSMVSFSPKDYSGDSFPGDHGLMLMIFAGFMFRYFGKKAFAVSIVILVAFMLPRIMAGAHWLTDIVVGSLSIALVGLSWVLLTPLADKCVDWLDGIVPGGKINN